MKRLVRFLLLVTGFIGGLWSEVVWCGEQKSGQFHVRVLLASSSTKASQISWKLGSQEGFVLRDPKSGSCETIRSNQVTIALKKGRLALNGRRFAISKVEIRPRKGHISYQGNRYAGAFWIVQHENTAYLVNRVDVEDYLFSVLRWEGWPGWAPEVNRVFAVTCRTYAVAKVLEARELHAEGYGAIYDLRATNQHQTYKGTHEYVELWKVLDDTRGLVMVHNGRPIIAMYDACCGGVIPAHLEGINFKVAPYLARKHACTYCKNSKLYRWHASYSLSDLNDWLASGSDNAVPVGDIKVGRRDRAGVVHEIRIKTNSAKWISITGSKIRGLLKGIKSLCFTLSKKGKAVDLEGKGNGHHVGLCQWGAREMVREGHTYKEVLKFYYPGIKFAKIQDVKKKNDPEA